MSRRVKRCVYVWVGEWAPRATSLDPCRERFFGGGNHGLTFAARHVNAERGRARRCRTRPRAEHAHTPQRPYLAPTPAHSEDMHPPYLL